jgi:hypothetical protein
MVERRDMDFEVEGGDHLRGWRRPRQGAIIDLGSFGGCAVVRLGALLRGSKSEFASAAARAEACAPAPSPTSRSPPSDRSGGRG